MSEVQKKTRPCPVCGKVVRDKFVHINEEHPELRLMYKHYEKNGKPRQHLECAKCGKATSYKTAHIHINCGQKIEDEPKLMKSKEEPVSEAVPVNNSLDNQILDIIDDAAGVCIENHLEYLESEVTRLTDENTQLIDALNKIKQLTQDRIDLSEV